ncbi:MAG: right-handed parallel beta-helix repeat-containing protein [Opitutales bacterium]
MFNHARSFTLTVVAFLFWAVAASATTYYVDFESGDNMADGQSPESAWKHAPGDGNATGNPAEAALAPGDTIVFKGGVAYHGALRLVESGASQEPITLDGNTAGTFGEGRAVLDGGRVIEGWQRVESPEAVQGNPHWEDLFYVDLDVDISSNFEYGEFVLHRKAPRDRQAPWQRIVLYDGEEGLLPIAQSPKPSDLFYPDLPGGFYKSPHALDVREEEEITLLTDEENLAAEDPGDYDGKFIAVHGGNNHVYFAPVKGYDPESHQLTLPEFEPGTYDETRYAFFNSVRLISEPGEWAIRPIGDGKSRVYLLPERLEDGKPADVGFPVFNTGITVDNGASHLEVRGFLIQRYSAGGGGISVSRSSTRSRDIVIADTEIRFVTGHAGIGLNHCDEIIVENAYIHHNPGWTTGIFLNRVNEFAVRNSRLDKNSGSGIRHYECKDGELVDNAILDHFGMHASAINVYEGCENILLERNYVQNTATINRNARNIVFRNNVIDSMNRSAVALAIWRSGSVGGHDVIDITIENNTFVRVNRGVGWSTGLFGQSGASTPRGVVVRNNILDRVSGELSGEFENNIYLREPAAPFMSDSNVVIADLEELFIDPENGDFRRRPGGPAIGMGADIAPPPEEPAIP